MNTWAWFLLIFCAVLRKLSAENDDNFGLERPDQQHVSSSGRLRRESEGRGITNRYDVDEEEEDEEAPVDQHAAFEKRAKPLKSIFMGIYKNYKSTYLGNRTSLEYKLSLRDRIAASAKNILAMRESVKVANSEELSNESMKVMNPDNLKQSAKIGEFEKETENKEKSEVEEKPDDEEKPNEKENLDDEEKPYDAEISDDEGNPADVEKPDNEEKPEDDAEMLTEEEQMKKEALQEFQKLEEKEVDNQASLDPSTKVGGSFLDLSQENEDISLPHSQQSPTSISSERDFYLQLLAKKKRKRKTSHKTKSRKHLKIRPPAGGDDPLIHAADNQYRYKVGPGLNMSLDMNNDIVKVKLDGFALRELLTGAWLEDHTEQGRGKKYDMMTKVLPLFILPFLIQSAIIPFLVTKLKLLLIKSMLVGKLAIFLLIISALRNSNKQMQTYEVAPSYWAGEPSRRSELPPSAASSPYSGYRVEGKPATWIN